MKITKIIMCITIVAIIVSLVSLAITIKNYTERDNYDDIFGKSFDGIIIFCFTMPFVISLNMTLSSGYRYLKTVCAKPKRWYFISYILSFFGIFAYLFISICINLDSIIDVKSFFSPLSISYILGRLIMVNALIITPLSVLLYIVAKKINNLTIDDT